MTNSIRDEFIGKEAEIVRTRNKQLLGLKGKIVDETKNSFKMLVNKRNFREFKVIMKQGNTFMIGKKLFDGNKIMKRPEDRIKLRD
ncbi:TPA: ribonuclease P protein subunit [Candidatus Woesearchaeota archaeon]|nr:ribonuclease P protein subunit [Candidatus Woesearchaeota archaeon]HIH31489.1 ribonuclease P protein subunit [Candidatus Woesearchaeota archaeon]HIH54166.1 ribonuclease P protein subunit [Candidatus Woesearchaeota archaeon]HIJ01110.1 ribonuclease P protein subunit [Candidatus Woesearchaeota archaeon]HIJ13878.1 ribonuclease P protein subunit [Candidatus Woesearchaeota archaeon]